MIEIIAFLGNTGTEYAKTRHNAAWIISENLSCMRALHWQNKFRGHYAYERPIHYVKPLTLMNLSGKCIAPLMQFFKLSADSLLVVHDDLQLPCGTVALKHGGGLGGHNGLRSIKAETGSDTFWRLRIGIDRPPHKDADIADYVLSPFTDAELQTIEHLAPICDELFNGLQEGHNPESYQELFKKRVLFF